MLIRPLFQRLAPANKQKGSLMLHSVLRPSFLAITISLLFLLGCSTSQGTRTQTHLSIDPDTVRAGRFDTGRMWTFDYPPVDYFKQTYDFTPDASWFEKARLSALRLPNCSASFVSEDGLVFTNHHCARGSLDAVNKPGENLHETGFLAASLAEERKVPNLHIDQLVLVEDVTGEVQQAFETGATDHERVGNRSKAITAIERRYGEKTKLICNVVSFYNGGKYALYGYKRYNDVRLVFAPETMMGYFGGDYDNFTYPRYDLDISFFRVYENGQPLKTANFFKWSAAGATENELVFVVGNPGSTNRLYSYAQVEFQRDVAYPYTSNIYNNAVRIYSDFIAGHPDKKMRFQTRLFGASNSQKLFAGRLTGLQDPILNAKKKDFERRFKAAVAAKPELKSLYASVWDDIEKLQEEKKRLFGEVNAYATRGTGRSALFSLASDVVDFATQMKQPEAERAPQFRGTGLDSLKRRIYPPEWELEIEREFLALQLNYMKSQFGDRNAEFNKLIGGRTVMDVASELVASGILTRKDQTMALLNGNPDDILSSSDPLLAFVAGTASQARDARQRYADVTGKEQAKVQLLGKAMFDVYGTSFPPDATFTLRLQDGVVKGYAYNGTIAPFFTTFYGLYDRHFSFGKKDPWNLPERWKNPPSTFDLSTPFNFSSTNDIIGGNSGSSVVNRNLEIVGIAFDGNIESLPNHVISMDEKMRCVSVHSSGILEALDDIYKAERIVKELKEGKISQ